MSEKMRERQIQCGESPAKKSGSLLCSFGSHCRLPQCPGGWRRESGRRPQGLAAKFCAEQAMVLCIGLLSTLWSISSSGSTEAPSGNGHENSGTHSGGVMPATRPAVFDSTWSVTQVDQALAQALVTLVLGSCSITYARCPSRHRKKGVRLECPGFHRQGSQDTDVIARCSRSVWAGER